MFNLHNLAGAWTYAIRTLPVILTLSRSEGEGSPAKEILHFVQDDEEGTQVDEVRGRREKVSGQELAADLGRLRLVSAVS